MKKPSALCRFTQTAKKFLLVHASPTARISQSLKMLPRSVSTLAGINALLGLEKRVLCHFREPFSFESCEARGSLGSRNTTFLRHSAGLLVSARPRTCSHRLLKFSLRGWLLVWLHVWTFSLWQPEPERLPWMVLFSQRKASSISNIVDNGLPVLGQSWPQAPTYAHWPWCNLKSRGLRSLAQRNQCSFSFLSLAVCCRKSRCLVLRSCGAESNYHRSQPPAA